MQPIIDIIYEKLTKYVDAYLLIHPPDCCYVDRGDSAAWDWATGVITRDNSFHDLDLSAIVPVGTKAVAIKVQVRANATQQPCMIKEGGNVKDIVSQQIWTQAANVVVSDNFLVAVSDDRKVQYKLPVTFDMCYLHICGWFIGNR